MTSSVKAMIDAANAVVPRVSFTEAKSLIN